MSSYDFENYEIYNYFMVIAKAKREEERADLWREGKDLIKKIYLFIN